MQTVPCPMEDKGICTIPDKTVVVSQGSVRIASRDDVEEFSPDLDLDGADLRRLNFDGSHDDLLGAAEALTMALETDTDETLAIAPVKAQELLRALEEAGITYGVIVPCSCGHIYST